MKKLGRDSLRPPFAWFGGKQWLAKIIHRYMPPHERYVDLFAGSASILFAKPRSPIEVINDLDSAVVNFYRILRDPEKYRELQRLVSLTPYSREEFLHCKEHWDNYCDDLLRAWAWFVAARQARNGLYGSSWSREVKDHRRAISMNVSRWLSGIDLLPDVHERLRGVQIENQDFRKIITRFDSPQTWFYADPPYVHSTRTDARYHKDMTDGDHIDLVGLLLNIQGMCLLSGYDSTLYEPLQVCGWEKEEIKTFCYASPGVSEPGESGSKKPPRTECLWLSPSLQNALKLVRLGQDQAA